MNFKKVLIAVDNSSNSLEAAKTGFDMARNFNAEVALIYVTEYVVPVSVGDPIEPLQSSEMFDSNKELAQKTVTNIIHRFAEGLRVKQFLPDGDIQDEIFRTAEKWNADILIVSTHGRTGLGHLLLGSIAESLIRNSKIPVLVVPMK